MKNGSLRTPRQRQLALAVALLTALLLLPGTVAAQTESEDDASDVYLRAKGRVTFRVYCANCHGAKGHGDGPLAELLSVKPADLTQLSANNRGKYPRENVHATIDGRSDVKGHGSREMPVWGEAFQKTLQPTWQDISDEERAQLKIVELVYFLESIQEKAE